MMTSESPDKLKSPERTTESPTAETSETSAMASQSGVLSPEEGIQDGTTVTFPKSFSKKALWYRADECYDEKEQSQLLSSHEIVAFRTEFEREDAFAMLHAADPRINIPEFDSKLIHAMGETLEWLLTHRKYTGFRNLDNGDNQLLLITGEAWRSKSMLSSAVVKNLQGMSDTRVSTLYFFCGNGSHSPASVLKSIIGLLLTQQPSLVSHLLKHRFLTRRIYFDHPNDFLAFTGLFCDMIKDDHFPGAYVILDSVDECEFESGWPTLKNLLRFIESTMSLKTKIRWVISSEKSSKLEALIKGRNFTSLHVDTTAPGMTEGFNKYLEQRVLKITKDQRHLAGYEAACAEIMKKAQCNFLWADIVCQVLERAKPWHSIDFLKEIPKGLGSLYAYMFKRVKELPYHDPQHYRDILTISAAAFQPPSLAELAILAQLPKHVDIASIVNECFGFLEVRSGLVQFRDKSAKDYIRDVMLQESTNSRLHSWMTREYIRSLKEIIDKEEDMASTRPTPKEVLTDPLSSFDSLCIGWMIHMCEIEDAAEQQDITNSTIAFCEKNILQWIDYLTLSKRLSSSVVQCRSRLLFLKSRPGKSNRLVKVIEDTYHLLYLHESANEVHCVPASNTLIICPDDNMFKQMHKAKLSSWIVTLPSMGLTQDRGVYDLWTPMHQFSSFGFSPNGRQLVSVSDFYSIIRIWDVATGAIQRAFRGNSDYFHSVEVSANGLIAYGSKDNEWAVWDSMTGELLHSGKAGQGNVTVRFSLDGSSLATADSSGITIWDTFRFDPVELGKHDSKAEAIEFSPNGKLLVSRCDRGPIKLWDLETHKLLHEIPNSSSAPVFSLDSQNIIGSEGKNINIWKVDTGEKVETWGGEYSISSIARSPDGRSLATTNQGRTISIWDIPNKSLKCTLPPPIKDSFPDSTIRFSPLGQYVAYCDYNIIRFGFSRAGEKSSQPLAKWQGTEYPMGAMAVSPDKKIVAMACDYSIVLLDIETGVQLKRFPYGVEDPRFFLSNVSRLTFSPNGQVLMSISEGGSVRIYATTTGEVVRKLKYNVRVHDAQFSHDGRYVALACNDDTVQIWDSDSQSGQEPKKVLEAPGGGAKRICFSPDGNYLASGGDHRVFVWTCGTWEQKRKFILGGKRDCVPSVAFFPSSKRILYSHKDGHRIILDLDQGQAACFSKTDSSYLQNPLAVAREGDDNDRRVWITWKGRKVIFIPWELQPSCWCVVGHKVVIGCLQGQILIFGFSPDAMPPEMDHLKSKLGEVA
ncbi:hypothetical protein F5Y10DRAFT_261366 [Nemania abortiva]|nr:hypothetical protein F5Y10DRAFT_261366 [Nemania abortiva]